MSCTGRLYKTNKWTSENLRNTRLPVAMSMVKMKIGMVGMRSRDEGPVMGTVPSRRLAWGAPERGRLAWALSYSQAFLSRVTEYSQYTSIHGLRYIGDTSLHVLERCFWAVAFLLAITAASYYISNLFIKFDLMPVIMSLSPQSTSVTDIPFPVITICNMNNMRRSEAETILSIKDPSGELDQKLIYDFCNTRTVPSDLDKNLTANWEYIKNFMVKVTQPCHELLMLCTWHSDPVSCSEIFNPSLTDDGMCCVFNRLNRDYIFRNPRDLSDLNVTFSFEAVDWSPERGYPEHTPYDHLPRRPRGPGTHLGLTVAVDAELSEYFCSSESSKGFKIMLNNPIETPKVSAYAVSVSPGQETKVIIKPHIMKATPQLVNIDLSKRLCYFESERNLAFYRTYTENNCILECEANFTLAFCGCVLYYMPKNQHSRICGRLDRICALNAQRMMELSMYDALVNLTILTNKKLTLCQCLPGCFELSYGFVLSTAPLTDQSTIKPDLQGDKNFKYFKENMAIVHFFFMDKQFSGTVRGILFGFTEFLSNAGGLLGLFMGFSFMSAVELIYFLTLRLWFYLQKQKKKQTKEAEDDHNKLEKTLKIGHIISNNYYPFHH